MSNSCPQVDSLSTLFSLLQAGQSCRWPVMQGAELLVLCSDHGREAMLTLQAAYALPGLFQRLLRRRSLYPERYDGCYLCLNAERDLCCWRQISEESADDKQQIAPLFCLAGIELTELG